MDTGLNIRRSTRRWFQYFTHEQFFWSDLVTLQKRAIAFFASPSYWLMISLHVIPVGVYRDIVFSPLSLELGSMLCIPANFFWDINVRFLSWEFWDFCRRHNYFRRFPKKSEVFRRSLKFSEDVRSLPKAKLSRKRLSTKSEIARKVLLFIHLHMVFFPYMGLS